jgi:hypothetical protein
MAIAGGLIAVQKGRWAESFKMGRRAGFIIGVLWIIAGMTLLMLATASNYQLLSVLRKAPPATLITSSASNYALTETKVLLTYGTMSYVSALKILEYALHLAATDAQDRHRSDWISLLVR